MDGYGDNMGRYDIHGGCGKYYRLTPNHNYRWFAKDDTEPHGTIVAVCGIHVLCPKCVAKLEHEVAVRDRALEYWQLNELTSHGFCFNECDLIDDVEDCEAFANSNPSKCPKLHDICERHLNGFRAKLESEATK